MRKIGDNSYAIDTPELRGLAALAAERNYNRQLPWPEELDPDGTHIVSTVMVHEHAQGKPVESHMRCRLLAKITGLKEAREGMIDVPMEFMPVPPEVLDATRRGRAA